MASPSTIRQNITDRAFRYRANANAPTGPKICALCGSKQNVEVGHVDGHEENSKPSNLFWTCRSCNVKSANAMRKAGLGRLTKQYNPAATGAESLGQWMNAVMSMKADGGTMSVADGVAMIRATSPEDRSRYAREIWGKRHQRGTDTVKRHNAAKKLVILTADKHGRPVAYLDSRKAGRLIRISYDKAKIMLATGEAVQEKAPTKNGGITPQKAAKKRFLKARAVKAATASKKPKRKNGLWDKIKKIGSKTTVHSIPKQSAKQTLSTRFKGQEIFKTKEGDYRVPGVEKESSFDSLADAKKFVERWASNPKRKRLKLQKNSKKGGFSVVQGKASAQVKPEGSAWAVYIRGDKPKQFKSVEAAAKYARLRVHEKAPASNPRSKAARKLKRGNPQEDAERMYHVFHGKPAAQVIEFVQQEHVHEWLWAAGTLVSIEVANNFKSMLLKAADPEDGDEEDVVMVAFSEDGRQAYFVGGDQDIDLDRLMDEFGLTEDDIRDHMKIGVVRKLTYRTSKNFEEKGKVDIDFYHKLGGEHSKGVMPDLVFKPLNPSMELVGGRYFVAPKDAQLGASPGVVG